MPETYSQRKLREARESQTEYDKRIAAGAEGFKAPLVKAGSGITALFKNPRAPEEDKNQNYNPEAQKPAIAKPSLTTLPAHKVGEARKGIAAPTIDQPKANTSTIASPASQQTTNTSALSGQLATVTKNIANREYDPAMNTPTAEKANPSGMGKWLNDPKIAKALMVTGASILATEPRRVPYSNSEVFGKAILQGMGTYEGEVEKEGAAAAAARKASITERETLVKEHQAETDRIKALMPDYDIDNNLTDSNGVAGFWAFNKRDFNDKTFVPASKSFLESLKAKGEGGNGGTEDYFKAQRLFFDINKTLALGESYDPETGLRRTMDPAEKADLKRQRTKLVQDYPVLSSEYTDSYSQGVK